MILAPYFNKRCYVPESHYLIDPHPYRLKHVQTAMDAYRYGDGGCSGVGWRCWKTATARNKEIECIGQVVGLTEFLITSQTYMNMVKVPERNL